MNTATRLLAMGFVWCFTTTSLLAIDDTGNKGADAKRNYPGRSFANLTDEGAWFWFPDPKAVYYEGKHKRTYFGWVSKAVSIRVGCYDHETKQITEATLREKLNPDSHSVPVLLVRPDGRLIAFYAKHYDKKATLYRVSKEPEDISSWGPEMEADTNGGYSDFVNVVQLTKEDNRIYLFRRGDNFSVSSDAIHWAPARKLIQRWKENRGHSPYLKVASNGQDTIHLAFTNAHPRELNNSVYYACYRNGTFYKADGSRIRDVESLPLNSAEADRVYDANRSGVTAWLWDIAITGSGDPVIAYVAYPEVDDHRYRYARWNGNRWEDHEVVRAGPGITQCKTEGYYSGGITIDHANPSIVYLSKCTKGVFEIERWVTADKGATWTSESVTSGSTKDNFRPMVPHGYRSGDVGLIWMYGDYMNFNGARFGDYDTVLKMK